MKHRKQRKPKSARDAKATPAQIEMQAKDLLAKVSPQTNANVFVLSSKVLLLTPQIRAKLIPPPTGDIPSLGYRIGQSIVHLKQKADNGDIEAVRALYHVTMMGAMALGRVGPVELVRSVAQSKSLWPVMSSSDDSAIAHNTKLFRRIALGSKMTTPSIPSLLRHESSELLWAATIWTEINRVRTFLKSVSNDTRVQLLQHSEVAWPCNIVGYNIVLKHDLIVECHGLPELSGDTAANDKWWRTLENIFEIATNGHWEKVPELRKTHERAAKAHSTSPDNYIRSNIKKNLKNKFYTRILKTAWNPDP